MCCADKAGDGASAEPRGGKQLRKMSLVHVDEEVKEALKLGNEHKRLVGDELSVAQVKPSAPSAGPITWPHHLTPSPGPITWPHHLTS
eukprot:649166-Prymnesium_polylepis.1